MALDIKLEKTPAALVRKGTNSIKGTLSIEESIILFSDEHGNQLVKLNISDIKNYQTFFGYLILYKIGTPIIVFKQPDKWIYKFRIDTASTIVGSLSGAPPPIGIASIILGNKIANQSPVLQSWVAFLKSQGISGKNGMSVKRIIITFMIMMPAVFILALLWVAVTG